MDDVVQFMKVSQNSRVDASEPSMGFEPMTPGVGDRSSSPLRYEGVEVLVGFEPTCAGLQSATWPLGHSTLVELRGVEPRSCLRSNLTRYGDATVRWPVLRAVCYHGTYHLIFDQDEETGGCGAFLFPGIPLPGLSFSGER